LLAPSTMTRVSVQRHTTQNVRHILHMMDTLRAHVLAVAHNLATYLYYNVFAPFYTKVNRMFAESETMMECVPCVRTIWVVWNLLEIGAHGQV
jgi:hypothetical protein